MGTKVQELFLGGGCGKGYDGGVDEEEPVDGGGECVGAEHCAEITLSPYHDHHL